MGGVERAFRTKNKSTNSEGGKPKAHMGKLNPNSNPATYIHTHPHRGKKAGRAALLLLSSLWFIGGSGAALVKLHHV